MRKIIAIIAAISLVFLQVTPSGWAKTAPADVKPATGVSSSTQGQGSPVPVKGGTQASKPPAVPVVPSDPTVSSMSPSPISPVTSAPVPTPSAPVPTALPAPEAPAPTDVSPSSLAAASAASVSGTGTQAAAESSSEPEPTEPAPTEEVPAPSAPTPAPEAPLPMVTDSTETDAAANAAGTGNQGTPTESPAEPVNPIQPATGNADPFQVLNYSFPNNPVDATYLGGTPTTPQTNNTVIQPSSGNFAAFEVLGYQFRHAPNTVHPGNENDYYVIYTNIGDFWVGPDFSVWPLYPVADLIFSQANLFPGDVNAIVASIEDGTFVPFSDPTWGGADLANVTEECVFRGSTVFPVIGSEGVVGPQQQQLPSSPFAGPPTPPLTAQDFEIIDYQSVGGPGGSNYIISTDIGVWDTRINSWTSTMVGSNDLRYQPPSDYPISYDLGATAGGPGTLYPVYPYAGFPGLDAAIESFESGEFWPLNLGYVYELADGRVLPATYPVLASGTLLEGHEDHATYPSAHSTTGSPPSRWCSDCDNIWIYTSVPYDPSMRPGAQPTTSTQSTTTPTLAENIATFLSEIGATLDYSNRLVDGALEPFLTSVEIPDSSLVGFGLDGIQISYVEGSSEISQIRFYGENDSTLFSVGQISGTQNYNITGPGGLLLDGVVSLLAGDAFSAVADITEAVSDMTASSRVEPEVIYTTYGNYLQAQADWNADGGVGPAPIWAGDLPSTDPRSRLPSMEDTPIYMSSALPALNADEVYVYLGTNIAGGEGLYQIRTTAGYDSPNDPGWYFSSQGWQDAMASEIATRPWWAQGALTMMLNSSNPWTEALEANQNDFNILVSSGYNQPVLNNITTYADNLDANNTSAENMVAIFEHVQSLFNEDQSVQFAASQNDTENPEGLHNVLDAMETGQAVCRDISTVMEYAFEYAVSTGQLGQNIQVDRVFNSNHMWLRVTDTDTGSTYDLDPHQVLGYQPLATRNVDPTQVLQASHTFGSTPVSGTD